MLCLTRDQKAAGSSLTGVNALWSLSKTHLSELCTGSTRPCLTERLLMGRKESNQTNYLTYLPIYSKKLFEENIRTSVSHRKYLSYR